MVEGEGKELGLYKMRQWRDPDKQKPINVFTVVVIRRLRTFKM